MLDDFEDIFRLTRFLNHLNWDTPGRHRWDEEFEEFVWTESVEKKCPGEESHETRNKLQYNRRWAVKSKRSKVGFFRLGFRILFCEWVRLWDWLDENWMSRCLFFFAISTWKIFVVWSCWSPFLPTAFVQHDSELIVNARVWLWMLQPTAGRAKRCLSSIYQACLGSTNVVGNIHEIRLLFVGFLRFFWTVEAWYGTRT